MSKELDAGPVLTKYNFQITNGMNAYDLDRKSMDYGVENLIYTIDSFFDKNFKYQAIDLNSLIINKRVMLENINIFHIKI